MKNTILFLSFFALLLTLCCIKTTAQITNKSQLPLNLQNGLVAFYPFNGNAGDSSGNGNHGVVNGAVSSKDLYGSLNGALDFNGSTSYISLPKITAIEGQSGFSLAFKINLSGKRTGGCVFNQWLTGIGGSGNNLGIQAGTLNATAFNASFLGGTGVNTPLSMIDTSRWSFVVFVFDGSQAITSRCRIYVNGIDRGVFGTQNIPALIGSSMPSLTLLGATSGYVGGPITSYFDGKLDDIFIYNRALSSTEANQLFTRTYPVALNVGLTDFTLSKNLVSENLPVQTEFGIFTPVDLTPGDEVVYTFTSGLGDADNSKFTILGDKLRINASFDYESKSTYTILVRAETLLGFAPPIDKQFTINVRNVTNESIPQNGLVAYYPFNGNYNDESTNKYNGTLNGTVGFVNDRFGVANRAVQFGSGYITASSSVFNFQRNQSFTVSFWLYRTTSGSGGRLLSNECPEGNFRVLAFADSVYSISYGDATNYLYDTISLNKWHHVVYVYDNRNVKQYVNGKLKATQVNNSVEGLNYCSPFTIGAKASSAFDKWIGKGDDIAVYNRALDSAEAVQLYTANGNICDPSSFNPLQDTVRVCGTTASLNAGSGYTSYVWSTGATSQSINPTSSGFYKVAVTNSNGCSASDSTYLSLVKATIIPRDTTICKGTSVKLNLSGVEKFIPTASLQTQEDITSGIVTYYPFNGNANDASGNGNNGLVFNVTPTLDRFGNLNSAYKFNGLESAQSSQVKSTKSIFNLGQDQYTIHLWFKLDNTSQITRALFNTDPHTGIAIGYNDNNAPGYVVYDLGPGNSFWTMLYRHGPKRDYVVGKWYSVSLTKSGTLYNFYNDGIKVDSYTNPSSVNYDLDVLFRLSGIADPSIGYQAFGGDIDDVLVYNRALSESQVSSLHNISSPLETTKYKIKWSTNDTTETISVSPTQTTQYYVTVSDGITSCQDTITVNVVDSSRFNPFSDTTSVCGTMHVLSATAGYASYSWNTGATTQSI